MSSTTTDAASATLCPRCDVALVAEPPHGGRCPSCGGHHLDAADAGRLLEREVGRTIDELKELAGMFAGEKLPCPGCGAEQSPITLRSVPVDLCLSCGGLWLDAGELTRLSNGRIKETPPPEGDLTVQARQRRSRAGTTEFTSGKHESFRFPKGMSSSQLIAIAVASLTLILPFGYSAYSGESPLDMWPVLALAPLGALFAGLHDYIEVDPHKRLVTQWSALYRRRRSKGVARFERVRAVWVRVSRSSGGAQGPGSTIYTVMIGLAGEEPLVLNFDKADQAETAAETIAHLIGTDFLRRGELLD